jgi:uncharacterized protein (TIGR02246 family)
MMERTTTFLLAWGLIAAAACSRNEPQAPAAAEAAVRAVIDRQAAAWNAGDLDGFLAGYVPTAELRFVTGADVVEGFELVRERYRTKYGTPARMGRLEFGDLEVRMLAPDAALATGSWQVDNDSGRHAGRFTLLFRRMGEGWFITLDHTS